MPSSQDNNPNNENPDEEREYPNPDDMYDSMRDDAVDYLDLKVKELIQKVSDNPYYSRKDEKLARHLIQAILSELNLESKKEIKLIEK